MATGGSASAMALMDAPTFKSDYDRDGFVVVPQLLDGDEVESLLDEMEAICRGQRGAVEGLVPAEDGETREDVMQKYLAIHFPHKLSETIRYLVQEPATVKGLTKLIGPDVKMCQTMMFMKGAGKRGQATHQDEYFIPTRDRSLTATWIALDDATIENGCLWVIPGSHKRGIIYPTKLQNDPRFDVSPASFGFENQGYSEDDFVPVELSSGDCIFFNGYLLHRSLENNSQGFRRAFANHYLSAQSMLPWTADGRFPEISGEGDNRDVMLVAGTDPYADWAPLQDLMMPFVRADSVEADPEQAKLHARMAKHV